MATRFRTSGIEMGSSIMDVSGTAPSYPARAWVNFNKVTAGAPIRASGNVTSITDRSTALFSVNFTTNMPDANYVMAGLPNQPGDNFLYMLMERFPATSGIVRTAGSITIFIGVVAGSPVSVTGSDVDQVNLVFFR